MPASNEWQHFDRFDGRKQSWRTYEENLISHAEGVTDDSGCNLSQTLFDTDMGGAAAGAVAFPVVPAAVAAAAGGGNPAPFLLDISKMQRLRNSRLTSAYQMLYQSISDADLRSTLFCSYPQPPRPAAAFANAAGPLRPYTELCRDDPEKPGLARPHDG